MAALGSRCSRPVQGHHYNSAGDGFFDLHTILPVISALCFAAYGVLTRYAARRDCRDQLLLDRGGWCH